MNNSGLSWPRLNVSRQRRKGGRVIAGVQKRGKRRGTAGKGPGKRGGRTDVVNRVVGRHALGDP